MLLQKGDEGATDAGGVGNLDCSHCIRPLLSKPPFEISIPATDVAGIFLSTIGPDDMSGMRLQMFFGDAAQHLVTRLVAVRVVDALEYQREGDKLNPGSDKQDRVWRLKARCLFGEHPSARDEKFEPRGQTGQ